MMLYFAFLGPILKFLRCRFFDYDHMIHMKKIFEKATSRVNEDCDIIEVMDQVRKSKNFQRSFLNRQQKILLKFDHSNIIDGNSEREVSGKEDSDHDDVIAANLNSPNGLVVIFTISKLLTILKPYIGLKELSHFDKNLLHSFYTPISVEEKPDRTKGLLSFLSARKVPLRNNTIELAPEQHPSELDPIMKRICGGIAVRETK